jgi:hypothetical protein
LFFGFGNTNYLHAINELVVTRNKLTNSFAGVVTGGLAPDVACGPPVVYGELRHN